MTAGYSGTPLARKLGITTGATLAVIDDPGHFGEIVAPLPEAVTVRNSARGKADVVVFFTKERRRLAQRIDSLGRMIFPNGAAWVAWPKRASKVPTDMTEDVVREFALPTGLVDVKVAAIDETWSGLKLVWRKERR
ncbi:MAG TPA: DUF3052 domain-containing protein [Acidimicrobiia bacterium]|jgi:hypothetical protein|nr:DUF3052 domain-containing protein [Acidimicrobiia bacterium]